MEIRKIITDLKFRSIKEIIKLLENNKCGYIIDKKDFIAYISFNHSFPPQNGEMIGCDYEIAITENNYFYLKPIQKYLYNNMLALSMEVVKCNQ